jgi:hypothetical protein
MKNLSGPIENALLVSVLVLLLLGAASGNSMGTGNNGQSCALTLFSGTNDIVEETGNSAVATWIHPDWVHPSWDNPQEAIWIWHTPEVVNPRTGDTFNFVRTFNWNGGVASAILQLSADNLYDVYLNGNLISSGHGTGNHLTVHTVDLTSYIQSGLNTLKIKVENLPLNSDDPHANPAGLLYRLDLQGENCNQCSPGQTNCYPQTLHECENGGSDICGTWTLQGNQYYANWENGATATLNVDSWGASGVVITRYDSGGSSAGLSARYEGQLNGNAIGNGKVTWTWNGSTWGGTWNANW